MPFVMLRANWPAAFRRTIISGGGKVTLEFKPGVPVDLTPSEISGVQADIGVALVPVEFDEKARPRVITDDVVIDDAAEVTPEAKPEVKPPRRSKKETSVEHADQ
jgi:hypothetical protein